MKTKEQQLDEFCNHYIPRTNIVEIINELKSNGVVFGCTEIALLITLEESSLSVLDTTIIHSKAAVDFALSE